MAINVKAHIAMGLLVAAGLILAACETLSSNVLEKSARGELRNETTVGVPLPPGCPTLTTSLPAEKTSITVSYQEPTTNQNQTPLTDLAYTTIYVSSSKGSAQAIRVWTNDAHGGALVTIRDIPVPAQELGVCVTATNWARKESHLASPTKPKP